MSEIDGLDNNLLDLKLQAALLKFRLGQVSISDIILISQHIPDTKKYVAFTMRYLRKSIFFDDKIKGDL